MFFLLWGNVVVLDLSNATEQVSELILGVEVGGAAC
jgi:hypothetical protein